MHGWSWHATVGVSLGVILYLAVLLPVLVRQHHRYGRIAVRRVLGAGVLTVYVVTLLAYTLLPLPLDDPASWCLGPVGDDTRLMQSLDDLREESGGYDALAMLGTSASRQVALNVLLFVPWGVIGRRYLGWGVLTTTATAAAASFLIETVQYTGALGLVGCSYRVADVIDLLANTLGGLLGAMAAPVVLWWMPQARELAVRRTDPRPVTGTRRVLGMVVDVATVEAVGTVLQAVSRADLSAAGRDVAVPPGWPVAVLGTALPVLLVIGLPPWITSGASWGQRAVLLEPRWPDARGRLVRGVLWRRVVRGYSALGLFGLLAVLGASPVPFVDTVWARSLQVVVVLASLVGLLVTTDRRGLACALTGARMVDVRARAPVHAAGPGHDGPSFETLVLQLPGVARGRGRVRRRDREELARRGPRGASRCPPVPAARHRAPRRRRAPRPPGDSG